MDVTHIVNAGDFYWGVKMIDETRWAVVESWDSGRSWICNCILESHEDCLTFIDGWMADCSRLN